MLMKAQAELFERGVKKVREPADLARSWPGWRSARPEKKAAPRKKKSCGAGDVNGGWVGWVEVPRRDRRGIS